MDTLTKQDLYKIGAFDGGGRYYLHADFCTHTSDNVRSPSRAWPLSIWAHCKTLKFRKSLNAKQCAGLGIKSALPAPAVSIKNWREGGVADSNVTQAKKVLVRRVDNFIETSTGERISVAFALDIRDAITEKESVAYHPGGGGSLVLSYEKQAVQIGCTRVLNSELDKIRAVL